MKLIGKIIKINAGFYYIKHNNKIYITRGIGKFRHIGITPLVGDNVEFKNETLVNVLKRKNFFHRPKIANIDQAIIVVSTTQPHYNSIWLNKMIAVFENKNIKPIIIFTKWDLLKIEQPEYYRRDGYEVFTISNITKENLDQISHLFPNKTSVLLGQSGVGKSSTIKELTSFDLLISAVSKKERGRHTTRMVEIHEWLGGEIIDTPGFSSYQLNITQEELAKTFHDFKALSKECKFKNCLHTKEIHCAVKIAVDNNKIYKERYNNYIKLLKEIHDGKIGRIHSYRTR